MITNLDDKINKILSDIIKEVGAAKVINVDTKIRLWTLGSFEHRCMPTQEAFAKLAEIIKTHLTDDGFVDIIWGPELNVTVIK